MKEMLRMADKSKVDEVKQMLEYTQKGTAKATVGNYMVVLRNDPLVRESMKYNKLTGRIDIVKKLWWNEEICKLDDDGRTYFYYFFERYYKLTSEKCMDKALRIEANSRAYHPICEYLEQLEWDGQERIRYVLQRYMGADASDFVYEVVKHFLMEALSRIYRPGCKADEMLCLVGQQGAGKSTFFRFLALNDDWFSDDLKQLNDSKIYEHLRGHWIMEMSEMIAAISAKSNEEIKSFLTRQKDTYRNPYDKYEEDRKRQCIFAGSTNTRQFIPFDRTGARRFLPIAIDSSKAEKHILDDEKEARAYFDQLWAEAMEIYWSTENKSSLLKFSKEMEQKISEYRKIYQKVQNICRIDETRTAYTVINYIYRNYADDLNPQGISHQFGLSVPQLNNLLLYQVEQSFSEFLNQVRVNRASELLLIPSKTVLEVAFEVGYRNSKTFTRNFVKLKGMTPTTFKQKYMGKASSV